MDFTVVRNVLHNNYQSRNLIGHYPFWVISPRNSTLFTRPFLAGRHARAGHVTSNSVYKQYRWALDRTGDLIMTSYNIIMHAN